MNIHLDSPLWWVSQVFAFIALVCFVWGWQIKNKVKMMLLIGIASTALVVSAAFLENYSLAVLFGLAAIRNFVFAYLDWRVSRKKYVPKWLSYFFAGVFAASTITASVLFMTIPSLRQYIAFGGTGWWLELFIMLTLLGLIVGNILKGTNLMRVSFIANRAFNIINHVYFGNVIAIVIATFSICSNFVFYFRQFIEWRKKRKNPDSGQQIGDGVEHNGNETENATEQSGEQAEETGGHPQHKIKAFRCDACGGALNAAQAEGVCLMCSFCGTPHQVYKE